MKFCILIFCLGWGLWNFILFLDKGWPKGSMEYWEHGLVRLLMSDIKLVASGFQVLEPKALVLCSVCSVKFLYLLQYHYVHFTPKVCCLQIKSLIQTASAWYRCLWLCLDWFGVADVHWIINLIWVCEREREVREKTISPNSQQFSEFGLNCMIVDVFLPLGEFQTWPRWSPPQVVHINSRTSFRNNRISNMCSFRFHLPRT